MAQESVESMVARIDERLNGFEEGLAEIKRALANLQGLPERIGRQDERIEAARKSASGAHDALRTVVKDVVAPMQKDVHTALGAKGVLLTLLMVGFPAVIIMASAMGAAILKSRENSVTIQDLRGEVDSLRDQIARSRP